MEGHTDPILQNRTGYRTGCPKCYIHEIFCNNLILMIYLNLYSHISAASVSLASLKLSKQLVYHNMILTLSQESPSLPRQYLSNKKSLSSTFLCFWSLKYLAIHSKWRFFNSKNISFFQCLAFSFGFLFVRGSHPYSLLEVPNVTNVRSRGYLKNLYPCFHITWGH